MAQQALAGPMQQSRSRRWRTKWGKYAIGYALTLPAVLYRFMYTVVPLLRTAWLSFSDKSLSREGSWVGLENFIYMAEDVLVREAMEFTVIYTVLATLLELVVGLAIALLLNQKLKLQWLTRVSSLLPWAAAPIVVGIMWRLIFFEGGGVLNDIVLRLNLAPMRIMWLSNPRLARMSVIVTTVWKNAPWAALLLLAGLKTIPRELIQAAEVDGAGVFARFRYITLPLLSPMMLVVVMLRGMGEVQTFGQILSLTHGGPGSATKIISIYAYNRFFQQGRYGYGSALVMFLLLLTVAVGGIFAFLLSRQERR